MTDSASTVFTTENTASRPAAPFPLRAVLLAALIPALLGSICALIAPPLISSDTTYGLIAWFNYLNGGTWNSIASLDTSNIAQSIETPVTWWPPGQYLVLGALHQIGIPLGIGVTLVSALSVLSLGLGMAKLAHLLGARGPVIPLISLATTFTYHSLSIFTAFIGGEALLIAIWPWTCIGAWKLRRNYPILAVTLPIFFLLGSYTKHSFAICSLSIQVFLLAEAIRDTLRSKKASPNRDRHLLYTSLALFSGGSLYILGRWLIIPSGPSPADLGFNPREPLVAWGFSFLAPILQLLGLEPIIGFISFHIYQRPTSSEIYTRLGPLLTLLSIFSLGMYTWFCCQKDIIGRISGYITIIYCTIMGILLQGGGSIDLGGRFYHPTAVLITLFLCHRCFSPEKTWRLISRLALIFSMAVGASLLFYRISVINSPSSHYYRSSERLSIVYASPTLQEELIKLAKIPGSVIFTGNPWLDLAVMINAPRSTRFFGSAPSGTFAASQSRCGRVPNLVLALPPDLTEGGMQEAFRRSFVNYHEDEWTLTSIDGWQIWQAGDATSTKEDL